MYKERYYRISTRFIRGLTQAFLNQHLLPQAQVESDLQFLRCEKLLCLSGETWGWALHTFKKAASTGFMVNEQKVETQLISQSVSIS